MTSPLNFDVLCHIFTFAITGSISDKTSELVSYPERKPPLALAISSTCQSWREAALATPQVWAEFSIQFRLSSKSEFSYRGSLLRRLELWLTRSGDHLLCFLCTVPVVYEARERAACSAALRLALKLSGSRWHDVGIWLPQSIWSSLNPGSNLASLKHLNLRVYPQIGTGLDSSVDKYNLQFHGRLFRSLPALTKVTSDHISSSMKQIIPLHHIRTLVVNVDGIFRFSLRVLQQFIWLEDLQIESQGVICAIGPQIQCSKLMNLSITRTTDSADYSDSSRFWRRLICPVLISLEIPLNINSYHSQGIFLQRHVPSLLHLKLTCHSLLEEMMQELTVPSTVAVEVELRLTEGQPMEFMLDTLSRTWPGLTSLTLVARVDSQYALGILGIFQDIDSSPYLFEALPALRTLQLRVITPDPGWASEHNFRVASVYTTTE
ncbi:hypothetical protein DL96DRAFT_1572524 [Flagelloscypha sp. PMI_526]|nr:hypothetical protein DL96DRAFT_1572524 [Flagelloscypha sp. PMI_526]